MYSAHNFKDGDKPKASDLNEMEDQLEKLYELPYGGIRSNDLSQDVRDKLASIIMESEVATVVRSILERM